MTTNLEPRSASSHTRTIPFQETHLWNTETQLSSPLAHLALYFSIFGFTDSKKGPMNGIFHVGPAIEPLFQTYLTRCATFQRARSATLPITAAKRLHWSYATRIITSVRAMLHPLRP